MAITFSTKVITDFCSTLSSYREAGVIGMPVFVTEEDWKILEQKIRVFQEHVRSFQREVEERLG